MNLATLAGVAVLLVSSILSQRIGLKAAEALDDRIKLKLVEVFPRRNLRFTALVFGMIIAFLLALYLFPHRFAIVTVAYAISFVVYILLKLVLNVKKLKEIGAPASYIRSVIISFAVFIGGAIAAATVIAFGNISLGS